MPPICLAFAMNFRSVSVSSGSLRGRSVCRRAGFRVCSEASGGFGSLCRPAIGGGSGTHYLGIFSGSDFIKKRLKGLRDLRIDGSTCARAEFSS